MAPARADLIRRDFTADASRLNTRWCGDITYIPAGEGWLYLATVIDIASRQVTGHAMTDHVRTELAADARQCPGCPRPHARCHLPRPTAAAGTPPPNTPPWPGTTAASFRTDEPGSAGTTPWPKASSAPSGASSLNRQRWDTRIELANAIFEYIEGFHNRRRRHSALHWQTPIEFETTTINRAPAPQIAVR